MAAAGAKLDFAALREFVAGRLAAFKVPRYWQQIDELPRTPTSRIAKHRLPDGHPPGEYDAAHFDAALADRPRHHQGEQ